MTSHNQDVLLTLEVWQNNEMAWLITLNNMVNNSWSKLIDFAGQNVHNKTEQNNLTTKQISRQDETNENGREQNTAKHDMITLKYLFTLNSSAQQQRHLRVEK